MENSILDLDPPPPPRLWKKKFFLKLDHFLRTFCKKCIFNIKIPKNLEIFSKNDKTTFRQANFCLLRCSNGLYTLNFVHNTRNYSLDMVLSPYDIYIYIYICEAWGGLEEPQGGTPPYT